MHDALDRLYKTKLQLLAVLSTITGIAFLVAAHLLQHQPDFRWLANLPLTDLGSALFTTGLLAVAFEYNDRKDGDERANQRLRQVLQEEAPAIRDAVIHGFAFAPDDLARVATPQVLDQIVENGLAIRLGDERFARELYVDIRDQAIRSVERWSDARINIRLSMDRGTAEGGAAASHTHQTTASERLVVTVRQEYTTVPVSQTRRFASVSDQDEYRELAEDGAANFVWFTNPSTGVDAGSTEAFELVQFGVNGTERPIRRSVRKGGQMLQRRPRRPRSRAAAASKAGLHLPPHAAGTQPLALPRRRPADARPRCRAGLQRHHDRTGQHARLHCLEPEEHHHQDTATGAGQDRRLGVRRLAAAEDRRHLRLDD